MTVLFGTVITLLGFIATVLACNAWHACVWKMAFDDCQSGMESKYRCPISVDYWL